MSPTQLKELKELSHIFSQGQASPKQIQQLSDLLAQINGAFELPLSQDNCIAEPR